MIQLLKMAFRDLGRNRRRSFLSALALGIGLALLLMMSATIRGEMSNALDTAIKLQSGHLQLRAQSYNEDKASLAWEDLVEKPDQIAAQVAALPQVKVATPRLYTSGIAGSSEESVGVRIVGIDPASAANEPIRSGMLSGDYLQADDHEGVLLGQTLADKLKVKAGQQVSLLVNTSNGEAAQQNFTVRGLYTTHTPGYDEVTIYMPLAKAQAISQTEGHASVIFVLLKNREDTQAVVTALQSNSQYQIKTWEQMNELVVSFESYANAMFAVLYLIILGITATVIVNTLVMSVFERTREIGILSSIGMRSSSIMAMFFAESAFLAMGGIVIGLGLGSLLVLYMARVGFHIGNYGATNSLMIGETIYASPNAGDFITLSVIAFIVSLLAALYPALLAARMDPVDALHGGKQA
jgi:ABC-type lipoprotein release transport system permease subunit